MWLIECGLMPNFPRSGLLYGAHNSGVATVPIGFVVLKGEGHVALVDTGFRVPDYGKDVATLYGVSRAVASDAAIRSIGIEPDEVDTIFLTHAHWDHMGNIAAFPNATVYIQTVEIERWMSAMALPPRFAFLQAAIDPADFQHLFERALKGQVRLVDGALYGAIPGVDLHPAFDTHTYGSQFVVVTSVGRDEKPFVAVGDCVTTYENIEGIGGDGRYVPLGHGLGSQFEMLRTFERIRTTVGGETGRIIPVHDPEAYRRFPSSDQADGLRIAEVVIQPEDASRAADPSRVN